MNATGLLAISSSILAAIRSRSLTQTLSAMPFKSAASLNACFSEENRRSSKYSSFAEPAVGLTCFFFICPALYGRGTTSQAKIFFLTLSGNVRTLYDMETAYYNGEKVTDGINEGVEARKQRGLEIAALAKINRKDGVYIVPSVTNPRHQKYQVRYSKETPTCTCEDFHQRGCRCFCFAEPYARGHVRSEWAHHHAPA